MKAVALFLLLPCLSLGQNNGALRPGRDFVLTEKEAVGMLPPKVVCEFEATNMAWSPDGRYVLIVRSDMKMTPASVRQLVAKPGQNGPPEGEESLMLVDVAKASSTKVWSTKSPVGRIQQLAWLPGTDTAYFTTTTTEYDSNTGTGSIKPDVYTLTGSMGKVQPLLNGNNGEQITLSISPLRPTGLIKIQKFDEGADGGPAEMTGSLIEILSNGRTGKRMPIPSSLIWSDIQWTADGARPLFGAGMPAASPDGSARAAQFLFDFETGKVQPVTGLQLYRPGLEVKELYVDMVNGQAQSGDKTEPVMNAWLKSRFQSKMSAAIIVGDGGAMISPTGDAILTVQQGVVMLRPLVRMPKDVFENALLAAEKTRLISDAKQCALGFIMYSADNDDNMPSAGGDWQSLIDPYVKNNQILSGFTYTFAGGDITKIENPATTEMGYKQGPGGRAVAYMDGHVKWIPDKP